MAVSSRKKATGIAVVLSELELEKMMKTQSNINISIKTQGNKATMSVPMKSFNYAVNKLKCNWPIAKSL